MTPLVEDISAERRLIGTMIVYPDTVKKITDILGQDGSEYFVNQQHQDLYAFFCMLHERHLHQPFAPQSWFDPCVDFYDAVTQREGLESKIPNWGSVIGEMSSYVDSFNLKYNCACVLKAAARRGAITALDKLRMCINEKQDTPALIAMVEDSLAAYKTAGETFNICESADALASLVLDNIESRVNIGGISTSGIATGIQQLDYYLHGMKPGDLCVLAARTSVGKSAFAISVAAHAALRQEANVLFFSLEMTNHQIINRLLNNLTGINPETVMPNNHIAMSKIKSAYEQLRNNKLTFVDPLINGRRVRMTAQQIAARCAQNSSENHIDLIIVDYLQLITPGRRMDRRDLEVSDSVKRLKDIAFELNAPVLVLSQLNRNADDPDSPPRLSQLKESGAIEEDADIIFLMHRPGKEKPCKQILMRNNALIPNTPQDWIREQRQLLTIYLAKHRNGPTGFADLRFINNEQRFESIGGSHNTNESDINEPEKYDPSFDEDETLF